MRVYLLVCMKCYDMNRWRKCANCRRNYLEKDADLIFESGRPYLTCPHCYFKNPYGHKVESEEFMFHHEGNCKMCGCDKRLNDKEVCKECFIKYYKNWSVS